MDNYMTVNGVKIKVRDKYGNATPEYREFMGENLYKMYQIKNRSDYDGSIIKYECTICNERGIFKERISTQSKDHIMEQVCYEVASHIGMSCCRASCRKSSGVYGSFSRYEVTDINNLITFESIVNTVDLSADHFMKACIRLSQGEINKFVINAYNILIFDFLLGQRDRHMENISLYNNKNSLSWYPLYDNGLCCFSNECNDNAIKLLNNGFYNSRMGTDEDILETISIYKDIIKNNIIRYDKINSRTLYNILDHSDKYNQLPKNRREQTVRFILNQQKRLNNVLGGASTNVYK